MLRVAAYCRVSTDNDDQTNSFESQQTFFKAYIERNPEWELVHIFADEGISGTSTKKRKEFNRMIAEAKSGQIDLILTKEVSRFARNTVDTLQYTRELKKLGVYVLFMSDNIHTKEPDAELRLTIMASIAQEESRKTSERVKWGQKRRMEQGVVFGRDMLGYDVRNGKLFINEEGAKTVRLIFHKFLEEGKGISAIARELREAGIETSTHRKEWTNTVILRVLKNEKYCGDLIQKKTFTPDYLSHEKKYNRGEEEFVILRGHHEPIISRELFERVQRELERRSPPPEQKAKYSSRHGLSGKIICGNCGSHFVARTKKRRDGTRYLTWRCYEAARHGPPKAGTAGSSTGCPISRQIRNEDFMRMIQQAVIHLRFNKEHLIHNLTATVQEVLSGCNAGETGTERLKQQINLVCGKKDKLLDLYLGKEITQDEYRRMAGRYERETENLEIKMCKAQIQGEPAEDQKEILQETSAIIRALILGEKQDDTFYRNIVEKIVVIRQESVEVHFNQLVHAWTFILADSPENAGITEPSDGTF